MSKHDFPLHLKVNLSLDFKWTMFPKFSPFWIAHQYDPDLLPISTIAAAITITAQSWRNSILIYCGCWLITCGWREGQIFFGGDLGVACLDLCFDCVMSDVFHSLFLLSYSLKVDWSNSIRLLYILGDKITSIKSHSQQQDILPDSSSTPNSSLTFVLGKIVWESSVANICIGQWHKAGQQAYLDCPFSSCICCSYLCLASFFRSLDRVFVALRYSCLAEFIYSYYTLSI